MRPAKGAPMNSHPPWYRDFFTGPVLDTVRKMFPSELTAAKADFLAAVRRALRPGGHFLLQTNLAAESVLATPIRRTWYPFGDIIMLHDTRYNPAVGMLTSEYGFVCDGKIECRTAHYRIY